MRTVVQRVKDASVKVLEENYEDSIGPGLLLLVGFTDDYLKLSPFAKLIGQIFASLIY